MKHAWPIVKLGDVLTSVQRMEKVDAAKEYRLLGIRLDGQGPFLRETVTGGQTSAPRLFRVVTGDFIYSRLFACRGAFGVIKDELDGCYVSGEFPTFRPKEDKLDVQFLKYWFRLPSIITAVDADCSGSTPLTRNRFKENFFSALEIPLPPLAEQQRIVARIEELASQIEEARTLRKQAVEQTAILGPSSMTDIFNQLGNVYQTQKLERLCDVVRGGSPRPAGSPLYYGGQIPFIKVGDLTKDDGMYLYEASATVNDLGREQSRYIGINTLMLTNSGATLGVPKITKTAGCFNDGSQAFLNLDPSLSIEYIYYFFKSKTMWFREQQARGQGQPNLNTEMTKQMDIPVPPLSEQLRIVAELDALQAEVDRLKKLQVETAADLDALLPALLDRAFKGEL